MLCDCEETSNDLSNLPNLQSKQQVYRAKSLTNLNLSQFPSIPNFLVTSRNKSQLGEISQPAETKCTTSRNHASPEENSQPAAMRICQQDNYSTSGNNSQLAETKLPTNI
jgi:hypothetical protein